MERGPRYVTDFRALLHLRTLTMLQDWLPFWMNALFPPSFFLFFSNFWDLTLYSLIWKPHPEKSTLNISHLWEILKMKASTHFLTLIAEWRKTPCCWLHRCFSVLAGCCGLFWSLLQPLPVSVIVASALSPSLLFWLNGHSDYLKLDYQVFFFLCFTISCLSQVTLTVTMKQSVLTLFYLIYYLWLVEHLICVSSPPELQLFCLQTYPR